MMDDHNSEHKPEQHTPPHHSAGGGMPEMPKVDFKNVNANSLKGGLSDVFKILKLDNATIEKVAHRESEGLGLSVVYFAVGTLAASLGPAIFGIPVPLFGTIRTDFVSALIGGVLLTVLGMVGFFVMNYVAESVFKGSAKFPQLFRVMAYASLVRVVNIITIIPFLSLVTGILLLVILYKVLTDLHKLNTTNAILTILITAVIFMVIGWILMSMGFGASFGMVGTSAYSLR